MNLQSVKLISESICLLVVAGSAAYIAIQVKGVQNDLHNTQVEIQTTVSSLNTTIQKVNSSYDSQAQSASAIERDIRVEMWHVDRTLTTLDGTLNSIPPIAVALTETARTASGTLKTAQTTIEGIDPVLEQATHDLEHLTPVEDESRRAIQSFDVLLRDDAIHRTLHNVADMTDSGDHIMLDFRRVADRETESYLKPVKWYMQPVKKFGDMWDIAGAVARHTP